MRRVRGRVVDGRFVRSDPLVLQPDVVLPGQYLATPRGLPAIAGERALMLAVLEMAVRDLTVWSKRSLPKVYDIQGYWREPVTMDRTRAWRAVHARRELMEWFRTDRTDYPFAFVSICETFNLSPNAIRRALESRGWKPERSPTHNHVTEQFKRQLHGGYRGGGR